MPLKSCLCAISLALSSLSLALPAFGGYDIESSDKSCSVKVLTSVDKAETAGGARGDAFVEFVRAPGVFQELAVKEALDRMPPLLCHGFERIVFVEKDIGDKTTLGIVYSDQPSTVYISANGPLKAAENDIRLDVPAPSGKPKNGGQFTKTVRRILHEAAHTAANLVQSQEMTDIFGEEPWGEAATEKASEVISNLRLYRGLEHEWKQLHASFVENSCAKGVEWLCSIGAGGFTLGAEYDPVLAAQVGDEATAQAHAGGFSTPYGAKNHHEDLAEVAMAALGKDLSKTTRNFGGYTVQTPEWEDACWLLGKEEGPGVASSVAVLFTKLAFVRDLELVPKSNFDDCVGKVGHQHSGQGYFSYKDNQPSKEYKINVKAHIGASLNLADPYHSFRFEAEGPTFFGTEPVTGRIRLKLDVASLAHPRGISAASWPRGLYLIDTNTGLFGNQFWFVVPEDRAGTFYALKAMVLVTGSSHQIVEGTVFVVAGWRPWAPFPVPQGGLPRKATFRAVKPEVNEEGVSDDPEVFSQ